MRTEDPPIYEIVAETISREGIVQLVKDCQSVHFLRRRSPDGQELSLSAPLHSDLAALAEARDLFPEDLPFAALPVDAT